MSVSPPSGTPSAADAEQPSGRTARVIPGYQGVINTVVRTVLRVPGLNRGAGNNLLTMNLVGRKSGKQYVVPVAYTKAGGVLLVGTSRDRAWTRNLVPGRPVQIRVKGRLHQADHQLVVDEAGVVELYNVIARDNKVNARYAGIGFRADGTPNQADLHQAWRGGAAVIRLTLR